MNSVFMNNFRGFKDTVVPFLPVNYLVGDNSTGKTSFLALTQLLSVPEFWFGCDFNAGDYEFGGYKDIVSALSSNQKEFQIGVCKNSPKEPEDKIYLLMHFQEAKDGLPELTRFSQLSREYFATMRLDSNEMSAAVTSDLSTCSNNASQKACFNYLQEMAGNRSLEYKTLASDDRFLRQRAILSFPMLLSEIFDDNSKVPGSLDLLTIGSYMMSYAGMAPIRTKPKRTYDGYAKRFSSDGDHTPYLIREILTGNGNQKEAFIKSLEEFGKDSGLFEKVDISQFGQDSASPFELTVTLNSKALRINSVGYGVSQVLPVVVELLTSSKNTWLAVQQPEVHLHPKAQAALGDVIYHAATNKSITLLIETHSDYLIDRFRLAMRKNENSKPFAQVIYFERTKEGNRLYPMLLENAGEYPEDQPEGFRKFFIAEQKDILGLL